MKRQFLLAFAMGYLACPSYGWDEHRTVMSQMMDTKAAASREYLKTLITVPSDDEQKKTISTIAATLAVNIEKIPLQKPGKVTVKNFLMDESDYRSVDEPDFGMDQDLPDSADPGGDRAWMGGKTGPTSQGFRHMYFPGIEWSSPLRTLQIPFKAIGQSPDRIVKLHELSQKFLQEKDSYWALRTLLWELHFVQDLHQPFHTTQVPYIKMLPWKELFRHFTQRSTQVIANYHYAYEGLVLESLQEGKVSQLAPCFELSENPAFPSMNEAMVKEIVKLSHERAYEIGVPLFQLWDSIMKDPLVDLPNGMGAVDYYSYLHANPDEEDQAEKTKAVQSLMKTTCDLMKHVSQLTFSELDQLFK